MSTKIVIVVLTGQAMPEASNNKWCEEFSRVESRLN